MRKKKSSPNSAPASRGLDLFFAPKRNVSTQIVYPRPQTPKKPRNPFDYALWSSSSLIPFVQNEAFNRVDAWISPFTQSQPCCLLYGCTGSGKSRIIEQIAIKHCLHVIEIDCASIKDVRRCIEESNEATQSRSVGSLTAYKENTPNSVVVFEHFDDLIPSNEKISPQLLALLSGSRVPILITSYTNPFKPEQWLYPVFVPKSDYCQDILMGALWMKNECREQWGDSIFKILFMNFDDMRQTALQMMFMQNNHNYLSREEQVYRSFPEFVENKSIEENKEIDGELYTLLMDNLCINDPDDLLFNQYIVRNDLVYQPFGHREKEMKERANLLHKRIPHSRTTYMEDVEILEMATLAAQNAVMRTRTMKQMPLDGVQFASSEIDDIAFWYLFE